MKGTNQRKKKKGNEHSMHQGIKSIAYKDNRAASSIYTLSRHPAAAAPSGTAQLQSPHPHNPAH